MSTLTDAAENVGLAVSLLAAHAQDADDYTETEHADTIAAVQDLRRRLALIEADLSTTLGARMGKGVANLSDGRQFTLRRSQDRREWDREGWTTDVRREVVRMALMSAEGGVRVVLDPDTGEETSLAALLHETIAKAQEAHGSAAPRTGQLKALGLYAGDYATTTPSGWRLSVIPPKPQEDA